jgi:CHASE domain
LTAVTLQDKKIWPFFVSPYFALHAQVSKSLTKAAIQCIYPIVPYTKRTDWELFSVTNYGWINNTQYTTPVVLNGITDKITASDSFGNYVLQKDGHSHKHDDNHRHLIDAGKVSKATTQVPTTTLARHLLDTTSTFRNENAYNLMTNNTITTTESIPPELAAKDGNNLIFSTITHQQSMYYGDLIKQRDNNPYYTPVWQSSPIILDYINFDLISYEGMNQTFLQMMNTSSTILSATFFPNVQPTNSSLQTPNPHTMFFTPIFKKFYTINEEQQQATSRSNDIVGFVGSLIPWDNFFSNLFDREVVNLVLVDPLSATFSFHIDGSSVSSTL